LPIYIRNKKEGDYIEVLGLNGKKKIKDIFINEKIPLSERDTYPILVDNEDNILWIPNIKKSKYNVKKDEFYDIILTSHKEGE
jgi:tRNA(Ile)-lysidine synthase